MLLLKMWENTILTLLIGKLGIMSVLSTSPEHAFFPHIIQFGQELQLQLQLNPALTDSLITDVVEFCSNGPASIRILPIINAISLSLHSVFFYFLN